MSIDLSDRQLTYDVKGDSPDSIEVEMQKLVADTLADLVKDESVRQAAREKDPKLLEEFDAYVSQSDDPAHAATNVITVQSEGAGLDPGTILILVTLGPPVIEHFVAPLTVHICQSLWDKFVLPRVERRFKKVVPKSKRKK